MLHGYIEASEAPRKFAANTTDTTAIEFGLIVVGVAALSFLAVGIFSWGMFEIFNSIGCEGFPPICLVK